MEVPKWVKETLFRPGPEQKRLFNAKLLQYSAGMAAVSWNRFQNNFYMERGMSLATIGSLKGIGLLLKVVGEPLFR